MTASKSPQAYVHKALMTKQPLVVSQCAMNVLEESFAPAKGQEQEPALHRSIQTRCWFPQESLELFAA
jgi:hypothetical protein